MSSPLGSISPALAVRGYEPHKDRKRGDDPDGQEAGDDPDETGRDEATKVTLSQTTRPPPPRGRQAVDDPAALVALSPEAMAQKRAARAEDDPG